MAKRKELSKKIRFEVFKRDKFTCQYCGAKAPDVILNVDHIDPVAKGGGNDIINLLTSCFACNSGKKAIPLDDNSVVEKQRKQLELIQERREQIELMLEWKKSLSNLNDDIIDMIVEYANSKMEVFSLNENGKLNVSKWVNKFETNSILDAIDISAKQYLKYENGKPTQDSTEIFINKIGGILTVSNMSPLKQKIAYVKGIARNRFPYWNEKRGSIILSNYIEELKQHWDEEALIEDLDKEIIPLTKDVESWNEWISTIEKWTSDIRGWEKQVKYEFEDTPLQKEEYSLEQLESFVRVDMWHQNDTKEALAHVASVYPNFEKEKFYIELDMCLLEFLRNHNDFDNVIDDYEQLKQRILSYIFEETTLNHYFHYHEEDNLGVLMILDTVTHDLLADIFSYCYHAGNLNNMKIEDLRIKIALNVKELEKGLVN